MRTKRLQFILIPIILLIMLARAASANQVTLVANCTGCTDLDTNILVTVNPDSAATAFLNVSSSVSLGKVKEHMQQRHRIGVSRWMISLLCRDYFRRMDGFAEIKPEINTGEASKNAKNRHLEELWSLKV